MSASTDKAVAGPPEEGLVRVLGVRSLAANAVNLTVGAGIFVLPATVGGMLGPAAIAAYAVCACIMGLVLACFAESGSRIARSGGTYTYVETAFGPYAGFVVGTLYWFGYGVLPDAAVSNALVSTLSEVHPFFAQPVTRAVFLAVLFGGLAWLNVRGVRQGSRMAVSATVIKLIPLLALVVFGLPAIQSENLSVEGWPPIEAVGSAALVLFFAFGGSEAALSVSGEIRNPARTIPRSILLGVVTVLGFYLALQLAAQGVLGDDLANSGSIPLAETAGRVLGPAGRSLLLAGAALSMFGLVGGDILAQPRALFAQARDGFFPAIVAHVHPRYRTPHVAIAIYAAMGFIFAVTGVFERLAALASAGLLVVYLAVCAATLKLRRMNVQESGTPFRTPGGPAIPILAVLFVVFLLSQAAASEFLGLAAIGAVITLVYFLRRRR